ncbi:hypothetical protein [Rubrivivax gelatinosus]|uniref:hypothetical protein n=1 Tax=Rubrivivax gelatinosus TaxID=28068 RepID=UPI0005C261FC|nr:hypothetical protein [Rubrivivax gelatinosus]MBG6081925.1 hypothetical protein [Rubrivivax gelatinosus]
MNKSAFIKGAVISACVVVIAGCGTVDTKTVVSNSDGYLATNFTAAQLSQPVRTIVEKGDVLPKLFERIDFVSSADIDEEGKVSRISATNSFINLGNGYIQSRVEYARNGVPYRINLGLTYAGIYRLKSQTVFVDRSNAYQPLETKEMTRFDRGLGKPTAGQSYTVETKTGMAPQLVNFTEEKHVCTAGGAVPASTVHASLSGTAIPLDCTMTGQAGVVVGKAKFVWIADLGVAFQTEYTSSRTTAQYKVESVSIKK